MSPNTPAGTGFASSENLVPVSAATFLPDTTGRYFLGVDQRGGDLNNAANRTQTMPPASGRFDLGAGAQWPGDSKEE